MINGYVESQNAKIHYISSKYKEGQSWILCVPGIMMPAWIWEKQLSYFSQKYNVIAIEPRSQGDSSQATEGHYALAMAHDIETVVDTLHLSPLILVGWSIAVPQVVNYAVNCHSKSLKGLVLVDGIVGADLNLSFYEPTVRLWSQFQMDRIQNTKKFIQSIFKQSPEDSYLEKLNEVALRTPTNTVMTLIYNYILQDFRPLLAQIKVPTFIATIEGPRLEYMRKMQQMIDNAKLEIFPSAGHALFVDQPEKFNSSLEKWISNL